MTDKIIPVTAVGNKISPLVKRLLFRNFIGNSVGDGFLPDQISNLELWLDALDFSTFTFNGSDVSQWNDKSGNGKNAAQSTAIEQPLFVSNGLNGLPTVRSVHAGASLGLEISGGLPIGVNAARTIFMVINPTGGFVSSEFFGRSTGNMIDFGTFKDPNDFNFTNRIRFRNAPSTTEAISAQGSVIYGTPHIITITQGTTLNSLNVFNESTPILTNVFNVFVWAMNVNLGIGKSLDAGARSYNGDISEIIVYSKVVSAVERNQVVSYLSRWGV